MRSLSILLLLFVPAFASAATLSFGTASGSVGATMSIPVYVSTASGEAMNAVSAGISFPPDKLSVVSVSKSPSIITLWAQEPSFSNTAGTVSLEGVVPNPGFSGSSGRVATITFRVKAAGSATLSFASASVLANDGKGTNILSSAPARVLTLSSAPPPEPAAPAQLKSGPVEAVATTSTSTPPLSEALPEPSSASNYVPITFAAAVIIVLAAIIVVLMYGWHRLLCVTHDLAKERTEADKIIRKSFTLLKHDLAQHITRLKRASRGRQLTSEEVVFLDEFSDELEEAEEYLEKKLAQEEKGRIVE